MSRARSVVLDNEAVQAMLDPDHRQHRRTLAVVEAVAARSLRRAGSARLVVPTAVRVEAGWDRGAPGAAPVNQLRADDAPLDGPLLTARLVSDAPWVSRSPMRIWPPSSRTRRVRWPCSPATSPTSTASPDISTPT